MTFLPTAAAPRIDLGGVTPGQNQQLDLDKDIGELIVSYAGTADAKPGVRGKPAARQGDGSPSDRSQDAGRDDTRTAAVNQEIADIDRQIAGIDDALSQTRHPIAETRLKDEREALLQTRERLLSQVSPEHGDVTQIADNEYAVDSDVQRKDFEASVEQAEARLDGKIAALEERRTELKEKMDGASQQEKAALANENREAQAEIKALQAQRSEVRAMADLPDAPDAMAMAADAYNAESKLGNTHLQRLSDQELRERGIDPAMMEDKDSGFHAEIYRNVNTGEMVLAFEGTDPTSRADWEANYDQSQGLETAQYEKAEELGQRFDDVFRDDKKMITGHSLGGGLAAYAGLSTGNDDIKVITFNASGLHDNTLASANDNGGVTREDAERTVTNFNLDGEVLTTLQEGEFVSPLLSVAIPALGMGNLALGKMLPDAVGKNYDIKAYDAGGDPISMFERAVGHKSIELHGTGERKDAPANSVQAEMNRGMDRMRDIIEAE